MSPALLARRARVRKIRRIVVAAAVTVFIALFATIYIQMAAGKDPALGAPAATAHVSASSSDDSSPADTSPGDAVTTAQS